MDPRPKWVKDLGLLYFHISMKLRTKKITNAGPAHCIRDGHQAVEFVLIDSPVTACQAMPTREPARRCLVAAVARVGGNAHLALRLTLGLLVPLSIDFRVSIDSTLPTGLNAQ
jgi:hypothetical protein